MKRSLGPGTILYPTPVLVVGTYDAAGRPNLMTVAWGGICSSRPPSVAISVREATHTYANLMAQRAFTVNVPSASQVRQADYVGIHSGRDVDKFAATGLTPIKGDFVNAPCVKEFPLALECRVTHVIDLGLHKQFVGEVLDVKADEDLLDANNQIDIEKLQPFMFAPGAGAYYGLGGCLGEAFSVGRGIG